MIKKQIGLWSRKRKSVVDRRFINSIRTQFLIVLMNVEARPLCLFSELMTLDRTVAMRMDASACARQVQKMMELAIWFLMMGIICTSSKPEVMIFFNGLYEIQTLKIYIYL